MPILASSALIHTELEADDETRLDVAHVAKKPSVLEDSVASQLLEGMLVAGKTWTLLGASVWWIRRILASDFRSVHFQREGQSVSCPVCSVSG